MLCWRLTLVLQSASRYGCLCQASVHSFSTRISHQVQTLRTGLLKWPQLACQTRAPPSRTKMIFTTKKRKFVPQYQKDGVNPSMKIIYENNMNRYYFWGQLIINALGVPSFALCVYILHTEWPKLDFSISGGILTPASYILFYGFLILVVNGLCRRSIQRIYADADAKKFTAVVQDWKFRWSKIDFDMSQVTRKSPGQVFGSFYGNLKIKGRSYLVAPTDFVQPVFYNKFMGYDLQRSIELDGIKDIDLKDYMKSQVLREELEKQKESGRR